MAVFSGCSGLASINIPASLTRINDYMFYNCTSLSEITLHDKITYIGAEDGSLIVTKDVTVSCTFMTGATAMEQTGDNKLCNRKVMIDGRIYILRNGRTYDVIGAELK